MDVPVLQAVLASKQAIRCSEKHGTKLRSLKTALMQDLLTGKKRVLSLLEAEGLVS